MKSVAEYRWASTCLTCFLLEMGWNTKVLYCHCSSTLLYSMPLGGFRSTRISWNYMVHLSFWFMLMILI